MWHRDTPVHPSPHHLSLPMPRQPNGANPQGTPSPVPASWPLKVPEAGDPSSRSIGTFGRRPETRGYTGAGATSPCRARESCPMAGTKGQSPCWWRAPICPSWATRDAWPQGAVEAGMKADLATGKAPQVCRARAMRLLPFIVGEESPHKLLQCDLSPEV